MTAASKIRLFSLLAIGLLIVSIVYYFATHGRISLQNLEGQTASLTRVSDDNSIGEPEDIKSGAIVGSGQYVIRNDKTNLLRVATIQVPGWFQSATVTFSEPKTVEIERVTGLSYENLFPADNGTLVSYTDLGGSAVGFTTHSEGDVFGGKSIDSSFPETITAPAPNRNGQLIGIAQGAISAYSFKTNTFKALAPLGDTTNTGEEEYTLKRSSDANSNTVVLYKGASRTISVVDGDTVLTVKKIDRQFTSILDVNNTHWAAVDSRGTKGTVEDDETRAFGVTIGDHKTNNTSYVELGLSRSVTDIALSPDSKYIAVIRNDQLWVYERVSKKVVIVNPYSQSNQLVWNNNKLYALSTDAGVVMYDVKVNQITGVVRGDAAGLSFSRAVPIGTKLYVTAYNSKFDSKLPDGYLIDLEKPSSGITKSLAEKLPVKTDTYEVNYLRNTIYIRINTMISDEGTPAYTARVERIKSEATQNLKQLLGENLLSKCTIVYL